MDWCLHCISYHTDKQLNNLDNITEISLESKLNVYYDLCIINITNDGTGGRWTLLPWKKVKECKSLIINKRCIIDKLDKAYLSKCNNFEAILKQSVYAPHIDQHHDFLKHCFRKSWKYLKICFLGNYTHIAICIIFK